MKFSVFFVIFISCFMSFTSVQGFSGGSKEQSTGTPVDAKVVKPSEVKIRYNSQKWGSLPEKVVTNKNAEIVLITATSHPAPHPEDMGLRYFHRRIEELTNSKVTTNYFPGGMLAKDARDILDLNMKGDIDVTRHDEAALTSIAPAYEVLSGLFLFSDSNHIYRFMERPEFIAKVENSMAEKNLIGLGSFAFARHFYAKNSIKSLNDLKGLKIRTMEIPVVMQAWNALGANATPLPFGDLFTGLQTGLVGAAEGSATAYYSNKFYEVAKYLVLVYYKQTIVTYTVNKKKFESFNTDIQKAIRQAGRETSELVREIYADWDKDIMDNLSKIGVVIVNQKDITDYNEWMERIKAAKLNDSLFQRTDRAFEKLIEITR